MGEPALIKLDDSLRGVTFLGIDTSPFIYFVERHPDYIDVMREIFRRVDSGTIEGYSSIVTLTEVLTRPIQAAAHALQHEYRELLLQSRHLTIVPTDAAVAEEAARLRAGQQLRTPDALQIATAMHSGCQAFLTNDRRLQRVTGIRVLVLDDIEL